MSAADAGAGDAVSAPERAWPSRARLRAEIWIVLGLSLGKSAVYAVMTLIKRYAAETPIGDQVTTINPSRNDVPWLDFIYQLLAIGFSIMPVVLAIYLLAADGKPAERLGLTGPARRWWGDLGVGVGLAALIGLPGLGVYFIGRALGQTVYVDTSGLPDQWWTATVLLLSAAAAAVLEEVVVVGYLVRRLQDLKWGPVAIILASAALRAGYHLYQGWPMALGNAAMGAVFAFVFLRRGRVGPLIAAHFLLDFVAFVGPEVVPASWLDALNAA